MKRLLLFLVSSLLLVGVAACAQREKPAVATPTLSIQAVLPASATDTPVALPSPVGTGQPSAQGTPRGTLQAQGTLPPNFVATAGPPPLVTPTTLNSSNPPVAQATNPPPAQPTSAPENPVTSSGGACTNPYVVGRGEWAYQIARKCGTTFNALQAANPTVNLAIVYPGQSLNLSGGASTTPPGGTSSGRRYVVRFGDTLYSIAARFGTTAYAIQLANHLANPNFIWVGQTLIIP